MCYREVKKRFYRNYVISVEYDNVDDIYVEEQDFMCVNCI